MARRQRQQKPDATCHSPTIMNTIRSAIISLFAATSAFAETPQFEIEARYQGFAPSLFRDISRTAKNTLPDGVQAAPRVTTNAGQTAVIEIIREIVLPVTVDGKAPEAPRSEPTLTVVNSRGMTTVDGRKTVNCRVSLEVSPELKDGQITLSGKSTVRQLLNPGRPQPLNAVSFATRETVFSDKVTDGQTIVIRVGDGLADKSQITLTVRKLSSK